LSGSNLYRAITWQIADAKAEFFVTISTGTVSPINGDKLVASRRFASHYQHATLIFHPRERDLSLRGRAHRDHERSSEQELSHREAFLAVCCIHPPTDNLPRPVMSS
jgi:hypothetical protein